MSSQRKPRFRYSLRALVVFITLFAVWGGYHGNRAWQERRAESVLLRAGAKLKNGRLPEHGQMARTLSLAYEAVVRFVWQKRFIREVQFYGQMTPDVVSAIIALPHLESLSINAPLPIEEPLVFTAEVRNRLRAGLGWPVRERRKATIPAGAIKHILSRQHLRNLGLGDCVLSAEDMDAIRRHTALEVLNVSGCNVSEDDLAGSFRLPRIRFFAFRYCQVRGDKLAAVPGSAQLTFIQCEETPVGIGFAGFVARCPNLANFTMKTPGIDDDFIAALGPHPSLGFLGLQKTQVTDKCIDFLGRMPALREVHLPRYGVTEQAAARLSAARPDVRVLHID